MGWVRVVVAGAVVVAGLAGAAGCGRPRGEVVPDPVAGCLEAWGQTTHSPAADARTGRLLEGDGGLWARVFLQPGWAGVCTEHGAFSTVLESRSASGIVEFFGGYDAVLKAEVLFGRVPEGTRRVEATLASGAMAAAQTDGEVFVVWRGAATFEQASVKALGAQGLLGVAETPSELDGAFSEQAFAVNCDKRVKEVVREGIPVPPQRLQLRNDAAVIWVFASDQVMVACHWTPGNRGAVAHEPGPGAQSPAGEFGSQMSALGEERGWIVGWAPAGTRRVEVVLANGTAVPATLDGQLFAAAWESPGSENLKLVGHTDSGTFTWVDGKTVFQPR